MKKQKDNTIKKEKKDPTKVENLIAEIGRLTIEIKQFKDINIKLQEDLKKSREKEEYLKSMLDKYAKFRGDLVSYIAHY